jgi:drug/metabolite transporter (DMT)-like permease
MERKTRTYTIDSIHPSIQEAAASLDPLVQSINDQGDEPVYTRRLSSVFYLPASAVNDNAEENINGKKPNTITRCLTFMGRFSGITYALVASLLFTCSNFAFKQLDIIIFDVLIIRFFTLALISFGFIMYKGYRLIPDCNVFLILIRSLFAAGGSILYYLGLTLLPLPDLTTIRYTQVVWTALLALIIFRERISIPTIMASVLTLIGVVCVAQPTFLFPQPKILNETLGETFTTDNNKRLFGMVVAVSCALSISISIVLNKKLMQRNVRQSIIMFYFFLITPIILLIIQIHYWVFSKTKRQEFNFKKVFITKDFIFATIIGVLQLVPMILLQKSVKREHPSIVTVVQSSDILFAIILQNAFTSSKTNLIALIGSMLVLTSIFIVGGHKLWLDRQNRTCIPTSIEENALEIETKK